MNILGKRSYLPFSRKSDRKKEKSMVSFTHVQKRLFAAKHSWTALHMSTPLFVGSYLQVTWWALGQWKGRNICIEWKLVLANKLATSFPGFSPTRPYERDRQVREGTWERGWWVGWLCLPIEELTTRFECTCEKNTRFYQKYWITFRGVKEITFNINQQKTSTAESPCSRAIFPLQLWHRDPHNLCVCSRLLFYSKCTGFAICLTDSDISPSMYINQC